MKMHLRVSLTLLGMFAALRLDAAGTGRQMSASAATSVRFFPTSAIPATGRTRKARKADLRLDTRRARRPTAAATRPSCRAIWRAAS